MTSYILKYYNLHALFSFPFFAFYQFFYPWQLNESILQVASQIHPLCSFLSFSAQSVGSFLFLPSGESPRRANTSSIVGVKNASRKIQPLMEGDQNSNTMGRSVGGRGPQISK